MRGRGLGVASLLISLAACKAKPEAAADAGTIAAPADSRGPSCESSNDMASVACNDIGDAYADGTEGHAKDPAQSVIYYQKSCDKGYRLGCRNLGVAHAVGSGVAMNRAKAVEYLERSCQAGLALGCDDLGALYDEGKAGGAIDQAKGFLAFQKGCELGSGRSCKELGRHYKDGLGVPKDVSKGISLYEKACESNRLACDDLGDVYAKGANVPVNKAKAKLYYDKACAQGLDMGCANAKAITP